VGRLFAARYHGRCADCGEPIEPGHHVTYEDDELVCAGCVFGDSEPARQPAPRERVCPGCWLVHAGSCEDAR
jgi:ribosomal protein L37E